MRRFLTGIVTFLALASNILAAGHVLVTPSNMNGWRGGTYSPYGQNSAGWYLGTKLGVQHIGKGAVWFYTGAADGIAFVETSNYKGTRVSEVDRLSYRTFTATGLQNIAPILSIHVDTTGDGNGDVWFMYSPEFNCLSVPRGAWATWETTNGVWWNDKNGSADRRTIAQWLKHYSGATIDTVRVQAGTWDRAASIFWFNSWLGADIVASTASPSGDVTFDFEPDSPNPGGVVPSPGTIPDVVITAHKIQDPQYYVSDGKVVGDPKRAGGPYAPSSAENYIPILFLGNWTLKEAISQRPGMGNPDQQFSQGGSFRLGGVPFYIPPNRKNVWSAYHYWDNSEHRLTVPVGLFQVREVYSVLNTLGGCRARDHMFIEFRGALGAVHRVELIGDRDVRDWNTHAYTNEVIVPTRPVWTRGPVRLDSQRFILPAVFQQQQLQSIVIIDKGSNGSCEMFHTRGCQRALLVGLTAKIAN